LAVVAVVSIKWYVFDIVIGQAGDADRSMIFWGLPIAFIGLFAGVGAIGLAVVARNAVTKGRQVPRP
jgi:Ni/Fe-hydrogenase subunit HybB-like protein